MHLDSCLHKCQFLQAFLNVPELNRLIMFSKNNKKSQMGRNSHL